MEALEIQVLSGVHAGASYRVSSATFRLGGDGDAELCLLDPGLETIELTFQLTSDTELAVLSRADYEVLDAYGVPVRPKTRWVLGHFLIVANVWLALARAGEALRERPASESKELAQVFADALTRPSGARARPLTEPPTRPQAGALDAPDPQALHARKMASIALGAIVALVLVAGLGVALVAISADNSLSNPATQAGSAASRRVLASSSTSSTLGVATSATVAVQTPQEVAAERLKTAQRALASLLEKAGLQSSTEVTWQPDAVSLEANINPSAVPQLEQVVLDFERDHGAACKLSVRVKPLWTQLSFRVREVVPGDNGWIVTDQGERVLVGGTVGGYVLTSVGPERVVLKGPQRVEIDL